MRLTIFDDEIEIKTQNGKQLKGKIIISNTRLRSSMKCNDRYRFGKHFRYHPITINYRVGSIDSHIDAIVTLKMNNHHTMLLE